LASSRNDRHLYALALESSGGGCEYSIAGRDYDAVVSKVDALMPNYVEKGLVCTIGP
jgi:hypothetical protein